MFLPHPGSLYSNVHTYLRISSSCHLGGNRTNATNDENALRIGYAADSLSLGTASRGIFFFCFFSFLVFKFFFGFVPDQIFRPSSANQGVAPGRTTLSTPCPGLQVDRVIEQRATDHWTRSSQCKLSCSREACCRGVAARETHGGRGRVGFVSDSLLSLFLLISCDQTKRFAVFLVSFFLASFFLLNPGQIPLPNRSLKGLRRIISPEMRDLDGIAS